MKNNMPETHVIPTICEKCGNKMYDEIRICNCKGQLNNLWDAAYPKIGGLKDKPIVMGTSGLAEFNNGLASLLHEPYYPILDSKRREELQELLDTAWPFMQSDTNSLILGKIGNVTTNQLKERSITPDNPKEENLIKLSKLIHENEMQDRVWKNIENKLDENG